MTDIAATVPRVSLATLVLGSGPRFARDAAGPVVAFYVGWKLAGLAIGVAAGTALAVAAYAWERRRARSGVAAALGLGVALVQAAVALLSGSALGYFVPPVIAAALYGGVFLGSVAIGRPLAGLFASEMYPFPPAVRASETFRRTFSRISLAWGVFLIARSGARLIVLSWRDVDLFVVMNLLTGLPFTVALMLWSLWYGLRSLRRSGVLDSSVDVPAAIPATAAVDSERR